MLGMALVVAAALSACDDSVQRRVGLITFMEGSLVCITDSRDVCMVADDADVLSAHRVGDCVSTQSNFFGVPGGVGTRDDPAKLISIVKLATSHC